MEKNDAVFPSTEDVPARLDLGSWFYYISGLHVTVRVYCTKPVHNKTCTSNPHDWHHTVFSFHCHAQNTSERRTDPSTKSLSLNFKGKWTLLKLMALGPNAAMQLHQDLNFNLFSFIY